MNYSRYFHLFNIRRRQTMKIEDIKHECQIRTIELASEKWDGRARAIAILARFGAKRVTELNKTQWVPYLEAIQEAIAAPAPAPPKQATVDVKFRIGERVRGTNNGWRGKIGEIVAYEVRYIIRPLTDKQPEHFSRRAEYLEAVPFNPPPPVAPSDNEWAQHADDYPHTHAKAESQLDQIRRSNAAVFDVIEWE